MAKAEQIRALISSHLQKDEEKFVTIALQLAATEARQGHNTLANQIRELIDNRARSSVKLVSVSDALADLLIPARVADDASSLVVRDSLEAKLNRIISEFYQSEKLAKFGLRNRRKILLSGPPGTGKTMTAAVLAAKSKLPLFTVQIDRLVTKYLGETSAKLRQIFTVIRERPGIYLFDEFDAIGAQRASDNDVGEMRRVLNSLLQFIEFDDSSSLIVGATNSVRMLDTALFRRFDDVLHYKNPEKDEVHQLLHNRLGSFLGAFKIEPVISSALGLSHAEITQACDDAIKDAVLSDRQYVTQKALVAMIRDRKNIYGRGD